MVKESSIDKNLVIFRLQFKALASWENLFKKAKNEKNPWVLSPNIELKHEYIHVPIAWCKFIFGRKGYLDLWAIIILVTNDSEIFFLHCINREVNNKLLPCKLITTPNTLQYLSELFKNIIHTCAWFLWVSLNLIKYL